MLDGSPIPSCSIAHHFSSYGIILHHLVSHRTTVQHLAPFSTIRLYVKYDSATPHLSAPSCTLMHHPISILHYAAPSFTFLHNFEPSYTRNAAPFYTIPYLSAPSDTIAQQHALFCAIMHHPAPTWYCPAPPSASRSISCTIPYYPAQPCTILRRRISTLHNSAPPCTNLVSSRPIWYPAPSCIILHYLAQSCIILHHHVPFCSILHNSALF